MIVLYDTRNGAILRIAQEGNEAHMTTDAPSFSAVARNVDVSLSGIQDYRIDPATKRVVAKTQVPAVFINNVWTGLPNPTSVQVEGPFGDYHVAEVRDGCLSLGGMAAGRYRLTFDAPGYLTTVREYDAP